jgi:hypothetical protein
MTPLPNLPRALLVRRMRAAAPELYGALEAARITLERNWQTINAEWGDSSNRIDDDPVVMRVRAALALVEGSAHGH